MKSIIAIISFFLSSSIFGQESGKVSITGDVDLDNYITEINNKAKDDYDGFRKEMNVQFGISTTDVDRYVKSEKVNPGDLYYGCSLSRETKKPVSDVMKKYKNNKSWGKVAQDLGIKPGTDEFKNFKGKTLKGKNSPVDTSKEDNNSQNKNQNQDQKQNKNDSGNNQGNINKDKK